MKSFFGILLIAFCVSAIGQTVRVGELKIGDVVLKDVRLRKSGTNVVVSHSTGLFTTSSIETIPEPQRTEIVEAAKQYEAKQAEAKRKQEESQRIAALAQRRAAFVKIGTNYIAKAKLDTVQVEISDIDRDGICGVRYWYKDIRKYGPGISERGITVGSELRHGEALFVRNFKGGSVGKKVTAKAKKMGTIEKHGKTVELWDCGTVPE